MSASGPPNAPWTTVEDPGVVGVQAATVVGEEEDRDRDHGEEREVDDPVGRDQPQDKPVAKRTAP